jgi:hypothetical protein
MPPPPEWLAGVPLIGASAADHWREIANADPLTGQAGWYDVRVRIYPAAADDPAITWPRADSVPAAPGTGAVPRVSVYFA